MESNGTYGFQVGSVPGYRSEPRNSSFNVTGGPVQVAIAFYLLHPPPPTFMIIFVESGLPSGTSWSVTIRGYTNTSDAARIGFVESNGTYGFQVGTVAGYRSQPLNSSLNVTGGPVRVPVTFILLHPPPQTFLVTFSETGLVNGTEWSVTVRGTMYSSEGSIILTYEYNGSYGFNVTPVVGYHAHPPNDGFVVSGGAVVVPITFQPVRTTFPVGWKETGLWSGMSWEIVIDGTRYSADGSWLTTELQNGTYVYQVADPPEFVPTPLIGTVNVSGAAQVVQVVFTRVLYAVEVSESGLPSNLVWRVRISNLTVNLASAPADVPVPNGTYSWDIVSPQGYYPSQSHGNVTIETAPINLSVRFLHVGPGPRLSAWLLTSRAAFVGGGIILGIGAAFLVAPRIVGRGGRAPRREGGSESP
jgi:hypothetical protein